MKTKIGNLVAVVAFVLAIIPVMAEPKQSCGEVGWGNQWPGNGVYGLPESSPLLLAFEVGLQTRVKIVNSFAFKLPYGSIAMVSLMKQA
jgi:hypothetical protein